MSGRAAALIGRPVGDTDPSLQDLTFAAGLLRDLIAWNLAAGGPDAAARPAEARLGGLAAELVEAGDPALAVLVDWWLAAVVGVTPQQLWHLHPLPDEVARAILPANWPPNLGADVKRRRFDGDLAHLADLAGTVPALSSVTKAQTLLSDFNAELKGVVAQLEAGAAGQPEQARHLQDRAEALIRAAGVIEGTPLHTKVRRALAERTVLAADLLERVRRLGSAFAPLTTSKVKALARLVTTSDADLTGRILASITGAMNAPEPAALGATIGGLARGLGEGDRFRIHRLLGATAAPLAAEAGDTDLTELVDEGHRIEADLSVALAELTPHASGETLDVLDLVRLYIEAGELDDARAGLADVEASVGRERARADAHRLLERAATRMVTNPLLDELREALAADETGRITALTRRGRDLPGIERKLVALTEAPSDSPGPVPVAVRPSTLTPAGTATGAGPVARELPQRLVRPAAAKPTPAYVIRVNAHDRFYDGRICTAPAANRQCASREQFKLDFCEKGEPRCSWLEAFARQPRVKLAEPFADEYKAVMDEGPPEEGDVAVLWAATPEGNEVVGLWRVLTVAPLRHGWSLNGDRNAAVLFPRGLVPWSAVYRRWSTPRGTKAIATMDPTGLQGLLHEVRDLLEAHAGDDPGRRRDVVAVETMLDDQLARQPLGTAAPSRPAAPATGAPAPTNGGLRAPSGRAPKTPPQVAAPARDAETPAAALHARLRARGGFYSATLVAQYELATSEARLVVLAGPSGTGKTRLAREVAVETGAEFLLVAVRPDWHANEDLLGYLPPFPGALFAATPAAEFLRAAAAEAETAPAQGREPRRFHLCLDEMNLARPEHYMAELLSKMEVPDGLVAFHAAGDETGFPAAVPYPPNLVVIGTVNLDETTLPISAKILDRSAYLMVEAQELRAFLDHLPEAGALPTWIPRLLVDLDGSLDDAGQGLGYRVAQRLVRWATLGTEQGHKAEDALDWAFAAQVVPRLRFTRSDPAHLDVLESLVGRLRGAEGEFPRSVALLDRMLNELRRQDFTLGQMRLS